MTRIGRIAALGLLAATPAAAQDVPVNATYVGKVEAVAPGFYGYVGVELATGRTCRGKSQVILLTSNPLYKDIYAALLTAQASGQTIKLYLPANQEPAFGYCTIAEMAIGNFKAW